jgi:hypothetical protein
MMFDFILVAARIPFCNFSKQFVSPFVLMGIPVILLMGVYCNDSSKLGTTHSNLKFGKVIATREKVWGGKVEFTLKS